LKEKLQLLISLQEADLSLARVRARKKELPERVEELNKSIKVLEQQVSESLKKYEEAQKRQREKEESLKRSQESLKKAKDRLFEVKTNKEYQAVLKEIDTIESKISELEDHIILGLDQMDQLKAEYTQTQKSYEGHFLQLDTERRQLSGELESLDSKLLTGQDNLQAIRWNVPEDLLKRYDMIKAINNGLAVVTAWKEVCGGCHMHIPPKLYNDIQKLEELMFCPNCNRIIYWQNKDEQ
jgi:predicted  nucleic acid-binding Zn-ribbon protein